MTYQARVAAYYAVLVLAGRQAARVPGFAADAYPVKVCCETGEALDDVEVRFSDGKRLLVQVKRGLGLERGESSQLGKACWQLVAAAHDDAELAIVVDRTSSSTITTDLAELLDTLRTQPLETPIGSAQRSTRLAHAEEVLLGHLRPAWHSQHGEVPATADLRQLMARTRIHVLDVEGNGGEFREAERLLRSSVVADSARAPGAWTHLLKVALELARLSSGIGLPQLHRALTDEGIALKPAPSLRSPRQERISVDEMAMAEGPEIGDHDILPELMGRRDEEIDRTEVLERPVRSSLDETAIEALLERAGDLFLEKQNQARADEVEARSTASPAGEPPAAPLLRTTPGLETLSPQDHLERLRSTNEGGAAQIELILREGGVLGLATAVRNDSLAHVLEILVAAARIVSTSGFLLEAEQAYLRASKLDLDAPGRARQFVRAARLARVQGDDARCAGHLNRAAEIDVENSTLAIEEARRSLDGHYALQRVESVRPFDDEERALLHQTRAQAHLALGSDDAARHELELATQASPTNLSVREFEGILVLHEAQMRATSGEDPNREALTQAGQMFDLMAEDLATGNRPIETASILSRAAEAFILADHHERAAEVLARLPAAELLPTEVAVFVAQTAMLCQQPELVLRLLPVGTAESLGQVLRAEAQIALPSTDEATVSKATAVLESFMRCDEEELAMRAAFGLLAASISRREIDWRDEAAAMIRADRADVAAAMRAERHFLLDEFEEAERSLFPYATTTHYQRRLRDYAAAAENWTKVADRSRQLVRERNDPGDRLALGHALQRTEGPTAALSEFLKVAHDAQADRRLRDAAFGAAMTITGDGRDYGATLEFAREWRNALPDSSNALWNILFALARLTQHEKAYHLAQKTQPDAATPERATLLAEIYYRAAPRNEAVTTIVALSDRFDRKIEALEALTIVSSLGAAQAEVDEALGERLTETLTTFEQRFPESRALRVIPAPQSAEELGELLKELAGDSPALQAEMLDAVRDGNAPVNAFAAAAPGRVSTTWQALNIMPLGFATTHHDAADRQSAGRAVGGAVVLDPSSLVVLGQLPTLMDKLLIALPGSVIANETLDDVDADSYPPGRRIARSEHQLDGSVTLHPVVDEAEALAAEHVARVLTLARSLEVLPPSGDGVSDEIQTMYDADTPAELKVLSATIALAQRLRRPIYTDDRWIREFARVNGVDAFGTAALLDVLLEHSVISGSEHRDARLGLTERGAWGLSLSQEELIMAGRATAFTLDRALTGAFHDRATWRARPAERFQDFGAFLAVVFDERPEAFGVWLHRVLDAAHAAIPHMRRSWFVEGLLLMSWGPTEPRALSDPCFHAMVEEVQALPPYLATRGHDAVLGAINQFMSLAAGRPQRERLLVFRLIVRRLPMADCFRAIQTFVDVT